MSDNMSLWAKVKCPPPESVKTITGGRLKGMHDIKPQWRLKVLTQVFGACGTGWRYTIDKMWREDGSDGQVMAFVVVSLYYKTGDGWSEPVPGLGGSMLVEKERAGLHTSDEGYKMALTDAISVAAKALGVAADVYEGQYDPSKYVKPDEPTIGDTGAIELLDYAGSVGADLDKFKAWALSKFGVSALTDLVQSQREEAFKMLERKQENG